MTLRIRTTRVDPVWMLVAVVSALSVALWYLFLGGLGPLVDAAPIPWVALAVTFAAVEARVVHIHFRSEATTFSFLEVPLVLGFLFMPGSQVWLAMTLGVAVSLSTIRRQPPIKAAFNTANLSLQAAVSVSVTHLLLGTTDALTPIGWLAVALAITVSSWVNIGAIVVAIVITEGRGDARQIVEMLRFGSVVSLSNTALALLAASLLDYSWANAILLLVPISVLFTGYKSYVSERAQRERVQFLYQSTSDLRAMDKHASIPDLLKNSVSMFRAESAYLFVVSTLQAEGRIRRFSSASEAKPFETLSGAEASTVESLLTGLREPRLLDSEQADALHALCGPVPRTGMVGALRSATDSVALLVVLNRLGDVTGFTDDDLALFSTLADQLGLAMVNNHLEQAVTTLRRVEQELEHKATHDSLTGLADRSVLSSVLEDAMNADSIPSVVYIDLDDFKVVNDNLGHQAGDMVLIETSKRLLNEVRPTDCVARIGGDEFAIVLIDAPNPELVARRIIESLHESMRIADHDVSIGASIGLAQAEPAQDAAVLLANADTAMYAAKARGKGAVEIYQNDLGDQPKNDDRPRTSLRQALDNDEIAVAYQPVVNLMSGETVGYEALARWRVPSGPVPAGEFIPDAESQGLIIPIDDRVMGQVFDDLQRIVQLSPSTEFVSLNISTKNLDDEKLVSRVERRLRETGADASKLVIEITEPGRRGDADHLAPQLAVLRQLGIRVALDDYGHGSSPSSVRTLHELPIDILKIGGHLVQDITTDSRLVGGLIALGRSLGLTVLAESIETEEQRDILQALGCELGQGFQLGCPVMRSELHHELATGIADRRRPAL